MDGIRAISIALVVLAHLAVSGGFLLVDRILWRFDVGNVGVRIFFVISGFLITNLLLRELDQKGRISLRQFYLRRVFRIAPAYYGLLLVVALLIPVGFVTATYSDLPKAGFFLSNYLYCSWALGHSWSLSVEEQFYLLWPGALVLLGLQKGGRLALALLLVAPAFRVLGDLGLWPTNPRYAFESVCDALATGCLLALYREFLWAWKPYRALIESQGLWLLAIGVLIFRALQPPTMLWDVVGIPALNFTIGMMIDKCIRQPRTLPGMVLNSAPVIWLGTLSYSLYLWQQVFLDERLSLPVYISLPAILAAAVVSHYAVERPFLKLRRRLES